MSLSSLVTVAEADTMAPAAALRARLSASTWTTADTTTQEAALQAATMAIRNARRPVYHLYGHESDDAVKLAAVVEAMYLLHGASDGGAATRASLQAQGVREVQVSGVREGYGRLDELSPATRAILAPYAVRSATIQ